MSQSVSPYVPILSPWSLALWSLSNVRQLCVGSVSGVMRMAQVRWIDISGCGAEQSAMEPVKEKVLLRSSDTDAINPTGFFGIILDNLRKNVISGKLMCIDLRHWTLQLQERNCNKLYPECAKQAASLESSRDRQIASALHVASQTDSQSDSQSEQPEHNFIAGENFSVVKS